MKVGELIQRLLKCDKDYDVVLRAYFTGGKSQLRAVEIPADKTSFELLDDDQYYFVIEGDTSKPTKPY